MGFFDWAGSVFDPDKVGSIAQNLEDTGFDSFEAFDAAQLAEQGVGEGAIAQNLAAAGAEDADLLAAGASSLTQADSVDFDFKNFAKNLGAAMSKQPPATPKAPAPPTGSIVSQAKPMAASSAAQPLAAPINYGSALQAIQGQNFGAAPTPQEIMRMRQLQGMR